ncbi:hypothetical protein [Dyadobacter frigoris]|uniref:Uncharacterized protein n=1 Tax=Dyadobacter frigoris TaxID=2576211 RepID=A0A4U6DCM6_9BACT|nr:hypothetical protein [Dyadobacter frigoris]TKT92124.1 hypothetical protein FDK13_13410 [Dyadobacter frigoris]GLU52988.1 hypothetical protein Dfri01_24490 [Dyadobacter frigoris]
MKLAIEDAFPKVSDSGCLQTFEKSFEIYDSDEEPKRCYVSNNVDQDVTLQFLILATKKLVLSR